MERGKTTNLRVIARAGSCPDRERWSLLAAGLLDEKESGRLLSHSASCGRCAELLKESVELMSEDSADMGDMPELKSSRPEWRREMAVQLARRAKPNYWLPIAAALALAFAGSGGWWLWREQHRAPLQLLAKAYTARRPVELRTPGAEWGEIRVERGATGGLQTPELLESEAKIARNITEHSADPAWLRAQGLAQLLEWKYDAAIESLKLANDLAPSGDPKGRAPVLVDLATAYFERAKAASNPLDYSLALESLSQALQADPSLDAALFNRAIVYESEHQYFLAADDWKKYLERDRSGPWADEARRRLAEIQKKIDAIKPTAKNRTDDLPEQEIENALRAGLKDGPGEPWKAVAERLERENGDKWLRDALAFAGNPAVPVLASMVDSRLQLNVARFSNDLTVLGQLQAASLPAPLRAWLAYEYVFRITHSTRIAEGMGSAEEVSRLCEARGYWYVLAQILLERSSFEEVRSQGLDAEAHLKTGLAISAQHHLQSERLRAIGFLDGRLVRMGRYREAANLDNEGLTIFWSRPFPWFRGQQFYARRSQTDESLGRYSSAASVAAASAELAGFAGSLQTEAVNHARSAALASQAGLMELATSQASRAQEIFARIPRNADTDSSRAFVESQLASASGTRAGLRPFEAAMKQSQKPLDAIPFLRVLGSIELREGHLPASESHLREALHKLETSLQTGAAQARRQWLFESDRVSRLLVTVLLEEHREEEALAFWDRHLAGDHPLPPRPALTYIRLGSRYGLWVQSSYGLRFEWIGGSADDVDRLARGYALLCSSPMSGVAAVEATGKRLRLLLEPKSHDRHLSVQPEGDLSRIPWGALFATGESVEVYPGRYAVSAREDGLPASKPLIVIGDLTEKAAALPDLDLEAEAVVSDMPGALMLRGKDATVSNVTRALASASFVHFAGHAVATPDGVGFLLAPEAESADPEKARGLFRIGPSAMPHLQRVVLSACGTARYEDTENAEPVNAATQLLQAGAREVVGSLWPVDALATAALMTELYSGLHKGQTTGQALAAASALLRTRPEYRRSYFWASFEVFKRD